ncbi:protein-tyrosine phosphatase family protein [Blastococcus brunescens]|uniref:Protein-tyrosine phosphatase family protein n=1 Tax=Blastococcus brunescens TaxID=1564165 RepID=A0ABZ1B3F3_9ACTN|nr:protein-tyrosine phosphatase family protein [Blastococcus sp. BMG 8361]WRL65337.1 protein-tyrosine phosphatase family protein [Blastococcus sp. BMG 8361]
MLTLPSGRRVLGRGLREPPPQQLPEHGVYLLGRRPPVTAWDQRWVRWRDFGLPADATDLREALRIAWERASGERVEIACRGGTGRTGTALACLAVLDGVPAEEAVAFVRRHYRPRAVETRRQRRFVLRFAENAQAPLQGPASSLPGVGAAGDRTLLPSALARAGRASDEGLSRG